MTCKIEYKSSVVKDLRQLDKTVARRILQRIEQDLGENPDRGTPLSGPFKGLFKYRIGDYRVIYTKTREGILILRIGHRSKVYR
ncbi:MAG: type II toxin-antitoxin system RelE/ParE family toxin [Thermoplasmata archaeon]|nr:type II toxin-antitoxin system RelE/ParE family toxin [Thermoplasmata archaeon]